MTTPENPQRQPIQIEREDVVTMRHVAYPLQHHQFLQLTKIYSFIAIWAHSFFAGTGVFLVTILAKLIDKHKFGGTSEVSSLEWITLGILTVLVLVFEAINFLVPSDKKTVTKTIQSHFDKFGNY